MSLVTRQSFKYSVIGYLGFLLGTFSSVFLFPMDYEFYGKLRFIVNSAELLTPFILFGVSYSSVKFFYRTQKKNEHQNMLFFSFFFILITFFVFLILFFLFSFIFPNFLESELWKYKFYILPLVLILSVSGLLGKYISNYKRIAVSNIFDNLFPKLGNFFAFGIFFFFGASLHLSFGVLLLFFLSSMFGYIYYLNRLETIKFHFSLNFLKEDALWKRFFSYSFFSFLGTFANQLSINNQMVGEFLGMKLMGVYSILYALISLISIPQMGLFNISAPIINEVLEEKNYAKLNEFYKKTSLSLFLLGAILLSCILLGFPFLASLMKNNELLMENQVVIWIWGLAILFDLSTGFNGHIISLSKYYRFNILMVILMSGVTILMNLYFIFYTELKLWGIAISTGVALVLYNGVKVFFNYHKFGVSPFSFSMLKVFLLCFFSFLVSYFLPIFEENIINLLYKPLFFLILCFLGNLIFKIFSLQEFFQKLKK